jgi:hypothetical protein
MLLFKLAMKMGDYMMDFLQHLGFPSKFRDWIAALFSSSS